MTIKWEPAELDDLIERYRSGQSPQSLAEHYGVSSKAITRVVRGLPDYRAASPAWEPPNLDDLFSRYRSGQSIKALSEHYGVNRGAVTRYVRELPEYRGISDANRLMSASRTPEQRTAYTAAAHDARRGQRESLELRTRRAESRQQRLTYSTSDELRLAAHLNMRGIAVIPQLAVGPYNCDLAVDRIAVEINGGHWHATGAHRARFPDRARYFFDRGWLLVIVWVTDYEPLRPAGLADYLVTLVEQTRSNPSLRGEYRVVWGSGNDCTRPGLKLDELARVPPRDRTHRART